MQIDAAIIQAFRDYYPEFSDDTVFTDSALTRYLEAADDETGSTRWGKYVESPASFKARGLFAYAAHRAVLNRAIERAVENGMTPPPARPVQSKSVGDESISYAVATPSSTGLMEQQGDLSTTAYGTEFLRLRKRASMGAVTTGQVKVMP